MPFALSLELLACGYARGSHDNRAALGMCLSHPQPAPLQQAPVAHAAITLRSRLFFPSTPLLHLEGEACTRPHIVVRERVGVFEEARRPKL